MFADAAARHDLERITHPRITELMQERIAAALAGPAPLVAVDIPLLFENARESMFEGVLLVYAPRDVQIRRHARAQRARRGGCAQRLAAQMPIDEKRDRATWVIDNSNGLEATSRAVDAWWEAVVR